MRNPSSDLSGALGKPHRRRLLQTSSAALLAGALAPIVGVSHARAEPLRTATAYKPKDSFFGAPFITREENRTGVIPHRLVIGGFEGTDTKFAFYFPEKATYQGRFIHFLQGGLGGSEPGLLVRDNIDDPYSALGDYLALAVSLGAYLVESNQGHIGSAMCRKGGNDASIYGHRASAESARLARHLAMEIYGRRPQHGYVYGGSGGARRSVNCLEGAPDVWDGAMPFMGSGSVVPAAQNDPKEPAHFNSHGFAAMFNVQRLFSAEEMARLVDAMDPGGSGDPFADLNHEQRTALAELYRLGYPRGDEIMIANPAGQIGLWAWTAESLKVEDPTYWKAFWTEKGYLGHDEPQLFARDLVDGEVTVRRVLTPRDLVTMAKEQGVEVSTMARYAAATHPERPLAIQVDETGGYLLGASLKFLTGKAAGRQLWVTNVSGPTLLGDGIDEAGNLRFTGVAVGDRLKIDNRDFLAMCYFHQHHAVGERPMASESQRVDGAPVYPQRPILHTSVLMGPSFTGAFQGKMMFVQHTHDASLWPDRAIEYAVGVKAAQGARADERFMLRWVQHSEHGGPPALPVKPAMITRLVPATGHVEQNLHDLVAWVEKDRRPAQEHYELTRDRRFILPATAAERGGVQPMVKAEANGGVRAQVKAGETVNFVVEAETPPHAGTIIKVEWDFDGQGRFPQVEAGVDGKSAKVRLATTHVFQAPGTYFPSVRVTSHRDGDLNARLRRVTNLDRVRVVVS